jgi:serine protease inhibitor
MRRHNPFRHLGIALGFIFAGAVGGCGGSSDGGSMSPSPPGPPSGPSTAPPAVMQAQQANTPVDAAIVTADNTFGLNLLQNLYSGTPGNVAIAPISVAMALQIVYNGAGGATQQGMAQTLQLGSLSTQELNSDNAALQGSLLNPDPQVNTAFDPSQTAPSPFTLADGTQVSVPMMHQSVFTATFGASLVQPLTTLGMQAAFCADSQASFPGLGLVCIQDVEHKTVVEVDESGTVAAGATTVTVMPTAVELPLFTLTVDQPFLYAIRDDKTGELLFIGTMANPS